MSRPWTPTHTHTGLLYQANTSEKHGFTPTGGAGSKHTRTAMNLHQPSVLQQRYVSPGVRRASNFFVLLWRGNKHSLAMLFVFHRPVSVPQNSRLAACLLEARQSPVSDHPKEGSRVTMNYAWSIPGPAHSGIIVFMITVSLTKLTAHLHCTSTSGQIGLTCIQQQPRTHHMDPYQSAQMHFSCTIYLSINIVCRPYPGSFQTFGFSPWPL